MSDYFYFVNRSVSCFLLLSTVISGTGLLCGLFLCIILHLGDTENGLGNWSITGSKRNSCCGLQNKSSSYCNVSNILIVLHGLIYIVFEHTLSMVQVSDREEAQWFQRTFSKNTCEDYWSQFCTAVSLVDLDFLAFRPLQLAQNMNKFPRTIQNTTFKQRNVCLLVMKLSHHAHFPTCHVTVEGVLRVGFLSHYPALIWFIIN